MIASAGSLRRHLFRVVAAAALAVALLVSLRPSAEAASYRNHVAHIPETPTSAETVTVWIESDTALGETAGVETLINGVYTNHYGTYDDASGPDPSNWRVELPAQPNGTTVEYQLFTRNQSNQNYGHTGFNWNYTVDDGDIQWDGLHHDTFDSYFRAPFGAVAAGTDVTLRFQTTPLDVDGVDLRVYTYDPATGSTSGPVDHPMTYLEDQGGYAIWTVTLDTPNTPSILYYHFVITDGLDVDTYSDDHGGPHDNVNQGGTGAAGDNQGAEGFQLTVYANGFQTPDWLQDAVVYQIFPDRFRNGDPSNDYCRAGGTTGCPLFYGDQDVLLREPWNTLIGDPRTPGPYFNEYGTQFYGGDLQGLIDKLDYLKAAGFDTIYTTPIFDGSSNHRYDTDDYMAIDPALGTLADFNELIDELEARDMYLIVDGVFNHTSSDSVYFDRYGRYPGNDGACESLASEYRDWFEFLNNDVPCGTGDYTGWFGYDSLAVLQDGSAEVRDTIYRDTNSVMETWYDRGVHGWRFDVADEISHNWWRDFRPFAKADAPNGPLVGEVWPDASAFLLGDQLDSVMNYRFRKNVLGFVRQAGFEDNDNNGNNEIISLTPSQFDRALRSVREDYPPQATAAMLNLLDSHDTNRLPYLMEIQGETEQQAKDRQKLAALFQYTYMGAPMVYYGDEVAIDSPSLANHVTNGPEDDPYNRAPYPWADEAGDDDIYGPADADMLAFYSRLAQIRQQYPVLVDGAFETLLTGDTSGSGADNTTYAYARPGIDDAPIVALNPGSSANTTAVPVAAYYVDGTTLEDMLTGDTYTVSGGEVALTLAARSGVLLLPATTTITVEKVVVGDASGLDDWAFTDPYSGIFNLPAGGGSTVLNVFPYAPLTVSETPVDGWDATAACDNGATGANSVEVTLDNGQDVTCVFTNTQDTSPTGELTITKVVVGSTPGADWAFTGGLGPFNLPASGGSATYSDQAVGEYTIDETYVPGWATTTSCTPGSETGGRSVTLTLDEDEAAECVFTNTLCQPGTYDDMAACVPTDPGYYTDVPGAVAPIACVPGYYQPNAGQISCLAADAGYYVDTTASIEQTACPAGTTSPAGSDSIDDCVSTTATLTIAKTTDPAGGTGFPFTLDPGAVTVVDTWGSLGVGQGQFNGPFGIALDAAGNVYIADTFDYRVQKYDGDGNFILMWGRDVEVGGVTGFEICLASETCKAGTNGSSDGEFNLPHGIVVDGDGNVYVADTNNNRIQKFDANGNFLGKWGGTASGTGDGQFNHPNGLAIDGSGDLYVADTGNNRIQKSDANGNFLGKWGGPTSGNGNGQFNNPYGVAVFGSTVYVSDTFNYRIQAFDTAGVYLHQWGSAGGGNGQFNYPYDVAVDGAGNVYVGEGLLAHRIQKFDGDGNYLDQWGSEGSGVGQLSGPVTLAVADGGDVYALEYGNHRVQRFSQTGATLDDGQSHPFTDLLPGTYLVSELVPDGWSLDDIACDGGSPVENGNAVNVTLEAGDDVTCTFSNSQLDTTAPTVTINQAAGQSDPTGSSPINFTVVFSEPVTGFATGDVTLSGTAGATTAVVTGSGTTYNVAVSGMTGSGTVIASVAANVAEDAAGNDNEASTSTDNTVTYNAPDTTAPTVTINQATGQADPTGSSPINFTVVFSEPVTGFATGDVTLSGTAGATTAIVTGSGTTYNVAVSGMTGSGTVIATVPANVAEDGAGNDNTASTSTDNTVTYNAPDATAPTVTINQAAGQDDPTSDSPINFTVVFSEPVTGFATGDVTLSGTAGATMAIVTGSGTTYNVAVSGMTGSGTVIAAVAANVAEDAAGNDNEASTSTDNTVTYDATAPDTTITGNPPNPSTSSSASFTFTGNDGGGVGGVTFECRVNAGLWIDCTSPQTYNGLSDGSYTFEVRAIDSLGNTDPTPAAYTWIIDTTGPTVTINQAAGQADPTSASPINFTVVFSEPVNGFATGDVTLSGAAGATTAVVTGGGTTYNVAVSGMTGSGTVIATVAANKAQDAAGNNNTASTSTDNQVTYNAPAPAGALYVTAAGGRITNGPTYQKNDILKWNGSAWSVWFDGATAGMLATTDIIAFDVANDAARSAWVVIRQSQALPGVGKMEPQQIAYYNGATWSRFFDGRDVGLLTTGERINGLEVLPGSASPIGSGCLYYLLISTTAGGGVPVGSGNTNFTGEDVLGFCMTSMGTNTAGTWHVVFEGQSQGLQKNNNLGLSANANASTLYFTVKSNFTGDGGLIRPSQLFSFSNGVFSGPLWRAADHGLTQQVDGIDVVGSIP